MPHGQIIVTVGGQPVGFVYNDRGVIDATMRYHTPEYMDGGPDAWALTEPVQVDAAILHHTAGWYGARLDERASAEDELAQLDALAADHRQRFGIGPGYHLACFPSGRTWAIGRARTSRAHTVGRNPATRRLWNETALGIVAFGDYEADELATSLKAALRNAVADARHWPGSRADIAVHEHGLTPTVNAAGVMLPQATACPGRNLAAWRAAGGLAGDVQLNPYQQGYRDGYRTGYGAGAADALVECSNGYDTGTRAAARLISAPPAPRNIPSQPVEVAS